MPDAPLPRPAMLRVHPPSSPRPSRAPFGLSAWSDDASAATLVLLDRTEDASAIASSLPDPASLPAGALVIVAGDSLARRGFFAKLLAGGAADGMTRHARATALLARGYTRIGAGVDAASGLDLVWGYVAGPAV
jgi:hypothetical protein